VLQHLDLAAVRSSAFWASTFRIGAVVTAGDVGLIYSRSSGLLANFVAFLGQRLFAKLISFAKRHGPHIFGGFALDHLATLSSLHQTGGRTLIPSHYLPPSRPDPRVAAALLRRRRAKNALHCPKRVLMHEPCFGRDGDYGTVEENAMVRTWPRTVIRCNISFETVGGSTAGKVFSRPLAVRRRPG
jgi:hypothetical protein